MDPFSKHLSRSISAYCRLFTCAICLVLLSACKEAERQAHSQAQSLQLNLGKVGVIARVSVNDKALGELWSRPLTIDISDAVKAGLNTLSVEVVTTWINRLLGDLKYPKQFVSRYIFP